MLQLSNADFVLFIVFLNNNNYTMFANLTNSYYILNTEDKECEAFQQPLPTAQNNKSLNSESVVFQESSGKSHFDRISSILLVLSY